MVRRPWLQLTQLMMMAMMTLARKEAKPVTAEECVGTSVTAYDEFSFIVCNYGYAYIQPCPQGTRNSQAVMKGIKDQFDSVCDENLVGEKGVKAKYPSASQYKLHTRRRYYPYQYPSGRQGNYAESGQQHGQRRPETHGKSDRRLFEQREKRGRLSSVKSTANSGPLETATPAHRPPAAVVAPPLPEPTKPVLLRGLPRANKGFLESVLDMQYVAREDANSELQPSAISRRRGSEREPSGRVRQVLYGVPREGQGADGPLITTSPPSIGILHNHSNSTKHRDKDHNEFHMERIRQMDSTESKDGNGGAKTAIMEPEGQSFASLFHNGQPMGYFSISQSNSDLYPSIDFYPMERRRNMQITRL